MRLRGGEGGQTAIEFGLLLIVLLMLTAGLIDVGRSVFLYNELSSITRFGARWGSVVGGTCALPYAQSSSDWCNQLGGQSGGFWTQSGNAPGQGLGVACPAYSSGATVLQGWYTGSAYTSSTTTTIVGAIAGKFDSDNARPNFFRAVFSPGVDLSSLHVCIQTTNATFSPQPGDSVTVNVAYPFTPAGSFFGRAQFTMTSDAHYVVE